MDFVGVVLSPVVEGVVPPSNNFGQAIVTVLESSNFTVIKKFGPLNKFAKDQFKALKDLVSFDNSANRPYEVEKSCMINALLKQCGWSNEVWVDLKSFMQLYKEAYGEPLLHEESTVDDVMKYIKNSELLSRFIRTEFIDLRIDTGRLSLANKAGDYIGNKGTASDVTVNVAVAKETGPAARQAVAEVGSHARQSFRKPQVPGNAVAMDLGKPVESGLTAARQAVPKNPVPDDDEWTDVWFY